MAFLNCEVFSKTLNMATALRVILPDEGELGAANTVYLLHGLSDNSSGWTRYTAVEQYARERGLAVVMPEVQRSFYADMAAGLDYFGYVAVELPAMCERMFGLPHERTKRYVMGLSMGGYVAMDIQRLYPETVAGLALCDTMAASDGVGGENRLKMADAAEQTNSVEPVMHFAQPADGDSTVKKTPEFIATMTGWINEQNPAGLAWRQRMTYGRPELGAVPETISAPSLVVSGELDPSSNPSVMRPLAERITGAEFIDIPDCGHFSAVEHPDTVARALLSLVRRVQSAQKNA